MKKKKKRNVQQLPAYHGNGGGGGGAVAYGYSCGLCGALYHTDCDCEPEYGDVNSDNDY